MSIYVGGEKAKLYRGDYGPAQLYKGDVKIAGYTDVEKVGTQISGTETYNDQLNPTIEGKSEQTVTANSPSPDHPEPIRSSENFDMVSCGRNLIGIQDTTIVLNNQYLRDSATDFTLYPNTNYTLSYDYVVNATSGKLGTGIGYGVDAYRKDILYMVYYPSQTSGRTAIAFNSGDIGFDKKLFVRYARSNMPATANVDISNVLLEFGATATPYEPYHATTAHITDPLRSVGDVSDSIEVSEGKVEVVRRCAQYIADGVIKPIFLQVYTSPECAGFVISAITSILTTGVCTHAKYSLGIVVSQTTQEEAYTPGGSPPEYVNLYFKLKKSRFQGWQESWTNAQKAEALKQWLIDQKMAGTPVIAQYLLYEPTRTDITATPLGQALLALRTYPNYTQVYTNATLPPTLRAKIKEMVL